MKTVMDKSSVACWHQDGVLAVCGARAACSRFIGVPARSSSARGRSAATSDNFRVVKVLRPGTGRAPAHRIDCGDTRGFTLIELLVILVVVAMFAAVTLPALLAAREPVLRAQCVNNLRQIATGWTIYQQEFNQVMPCHWPGYTDSSGTSNPWRTYEAYRVVPGTGQIITDPPAAGPWNLGVLFATSLVPGPRLFYCPATARVNRTFGYDYYATISNTWPSTPVGSGDDKIRTSYNYYPQLRALAPSGYQGKLVPKPAYTPTKWADLDGKKSIATDLVTSTGSMGHRASGSVAGLNALFPDGRVVFQTPHNNPEPFDPNLWDPGGVIIGNSAPEFRYVMSLWKP